MKKSMYKIFFSLLIMTMMLMGCSTLPQTAVMGEIRRIDNIGSYHIPVSLLNSVVGLDKLNVPGLNIDALKDVRSVDVMSIQDNKATNKTHKLLEDFYKGNVYEILFQAKEGKNKGVSIYGLSTVRDEYNHIILINEDYKEITIVELKGTMSKKDLKFLQ